MRLIDRIAQCAAPLIVEDRATGERVRLTGAADSADSVASCPLRYVLSDDLTRLCAALAYSRGSRSLDCADLIHVPSELIWVEWSQSPWLDELRRFGFRVAADHAGIGRRGALISASPDGRCGTMRSYWTVGEGDQEVHAGSMLAHFDFDSTEDREPRFTGFASAGELRVVDAETPRHDLIGQCFRFEFEDTWADYYNRARLSGCTRTAVERHCLGTIAPDVPLMLVFFLLLSTRCGIRQTPVSMLRLNRTRARSGRAPLLDHIDVRSPLMPDGLPYASGPNALGHGRRGPRLHAVRGHLVRRGDRIFWRLPHLRGHARLGSVRTRTVTWSFDRGSSRASRPGRALAAAAL